jgi:lipopolysaccharide biosynthesis glycosyltransferase
MVSMYGAKIYSTQDFVVNLGYIKESLSDKSKKLVLDFCKVFEIDVNLKEFEFNFQVKTSNLPIQAYICLLWLDTLEDPFLWLDADTLPLENWDTVFNNLNGKKPETALFAALDTDVIKKKLKLYPKNQAYLRGAQSYINSGVFLGIPEVWRKLQFNQKWPEVAANHAELGFEHHDQDVLNYLLYENMHIISSTFNSLVMQNSLIDQKILHFTGQPKPWHFSEKAKSYFSSIEILSGTNGQGAFGGVNWRFEYQNYWRHENALLKSTLPETQLSIDLQDLFFNSRKHLMARNDKIKHKLLLMTGRKWRKS